MRCSAAAWLPLFLLLAFSCGTSRKLNEVRERQIAAGIRLPASRSLPENIDTSRSSSRDSLVVTGPDGRRMLIMRAVKDENTGEMVASEELDAAVVTARFRNVAERGGKVNLEFEVIVPRAMRDSRWQLRLHPRLVVQEDTLSLDDVIVTGLKYRAGQLRGYQLYERFVSRIVYDPDAFVHRKWLELFLKRNFPDFYALKADTSYVAYDFARSVFGVSEQEAVEHYTDKFMRWRNNRLKEMKPDKWRKYVKAPIVTEGVKIDTVMSGAEGGDLVYDYLYSMRTRRGLRKADIYLFGEIFDQDRKLYGIPVSEPLTFYISSLAGFADPSPRYLRKVVERRVDEQRSALLDFRTGDAAIDESLGRNAAEIEKIKMTLRPLLMSDELELDSIVVFASASPEGDRRSNERLSYRRAQSASAYFSDFVGRLKDSLRREDGVFISMDGGRETVSYSQRSGREIDFIARSGGEAWTDLSVLVETDSLLSAADKRIYAAVCETWADADLREKRLREKAFYPYIRKELYPRLRTVRFLFHSHRRGMVKDTVHTSVLDTAYMDGVRALSEHDYDKALEILSPYADYNAAVAMLALGRNLSALAILRSLPRTARTDYMSAIIYSRLGDERSAVESYVRACSDDPSLVFRGNLDPEISELIDKYELNQN